MYLNKLVANATKLLFYHTKGKKSGREKTNKQTI